MQDMVKTRILFVIDALQYGGGERVFSQIINGLPLKNYEIFVAAHHNRRFREAIRDPKVICYFELDFSSRINISLPFQLAKIIRDQKINIVHGQGARAEFYARIAKRLNRRANYVSTLSMPVEGFDVGPLLKGFYRLFDRLTERYVDRFIVVSDALKRFMINERLIAPDRVVCIYNGIEIEKHKPDLQARNRIREEFGLEEHISVIGAIGRLVWQKGFEYLIKAAPKVLNLQPNIKIMIIGEGPLLAELKTLSEQIGLKNQIIFTGFRSDVGALLSAIDIFVIPSVLEGFPMVTLEAMAAEKPIVASNIPGINEQIFDGKTGILVTPTNPNEISNRIIELLSNVSYRRTLSSKATKKVRDFFSVEYMVKATIRVYDSL
jgi:glycosyltransferase involved in cell wall biosynthesis